MSQIKPFIAQAALVGTYTYFVKNRILGPQGLNKLVGAVALSAIFHAGRRYSERNTDLKNRDTGLEILTHLATFALISGGAHLAKIPFKTALLSAAFFISAETLIDLAMNPSETRKLASQAPHPYKPATIPTPAQDIQEEAAQIVKAMPGRPLKEKAKVLLWVTSLRTTPDPRAIFNQHKSSTAISDLQRAHFCCEAAKHFNDITILGQIFDEWVSQQKSIPKSAVMVALARTHREIDGEADVTRYLNQCDRTSSEVKYWIGHSLDPDLPEPKPKAPADPAVRGTESPFTRFETHLEKGEIEQARLETRKVTHNLYWRVEALCRLAEAEAKKT